VRYLTSTLVGAILTVATIVTGASTTVADVADGTSVAGAEEGSARPPTPRRERLVTAQPRAPRYSMLQ
jgi:hypothetical protein